MAMPMLGDNAAARFMRGVRENVSMALLAVGAATCDMAVQAAVSSSSPPAEVVLPRRVWLGALAAAVVGGVCTMWAALWVAANAPRRRAAGQAILCAAFVPFVVAVRLSGSDPKLVFSVFDAMLV